MNHTTDPPAYLPPSFTPGETLEWTKSFDDFPPDEWTVTYYFRGAGVGFDVVGILLDDDHFFTAASSTTDDTTAGRYYFQAWAVKGSEKHLVDSGEIEALASLAATTSTATTFDGRSRAKKILDAIDELMKGKMSADQQKYMIASGVPGFSSQREIERIDPAALLELRKYYAAIVRSENRRKNGSPFRTINIQFDQPS